MPSYEKNKNSGLWSVRFRETVDNVTHQKRLSGYKTKKEAQYGYEDYIKKQDAVLKAQKDKNNPGNILFDDLLAEYLKFTAKRVKESSFYDIENKINSKIRPAFTGMRMHEITPRVISEWINEIDCSYNYRIYLYSRMASIIKYGNKYYDIPDIMYKVDRPRNLEIKKEMQIWTASEFKAFYDALNSDLYRLFFLTLYIMGCRKGEAMALTWNDIECDCIKINKSVTNKSKDAAYAITTPKNKSSIRTIPAPQFLLEKFRQYKSNDQTDDMFVFGGTRPVATSSVDFAFNTAIRKSGVKKIRIHDLRHSCASTLISNGVSIVAVSRQLGHSNIEQTLNTYSHMMPDDQSKIRNALEILGTNLGTQF